MALAPEQAGIGIGRHFTTEGIHPYDELAWERRDARITNWADGSVAFEQLGVEFPTSWSVNATNIVAQKYFRGTPGTPERESSLRQVIDRVADTITTWGIEGGYFVDTREAEAFNAELKHLLVTQKAAFNSPVWFNIGVPGVPQQASACFILSVDDTMDSILNWYVEEGKIFKGGSGSGINLSRIRSSAELLKGGGTASGPVSFMRGADASAGTIKSGGKTRRAAKMVILNVDHPDIEEFIWVKAREEQKIRVLAEAGFDMSLDGRDMASVQYQNANNSVRVTDEFMQAVLDDADWQLRAVTTGEVVRTVRARDLMRQIAQAAWECADPGMQFDTTINRWHTAANTGRINGSNPCFTGDSWVHTDRGLVQFADLIDRVRLGETFGVYTHDATNPQAPAELLEITSPEAVMITGHNEVVKLRFSNGMELRCTPGHRIWTTNRGYVPAEELTAHDEVKTLSLPAPAVSADWRLPAPARSLVAENSLVAEKWTAELAHYLGWLVGDGCIGGDVVTTSYGSAEEQAEILPRHRAVLTEVAGGQEPTASVQADGSVQLQVGHGAVVRWLEALGVVAGPTRTRVVPRSINEAPPEIVSAFLQGLFDADGHAADRGDAADRGERGDAGCYVGLGSTSPELLRGVQRLLSTYGVFSSTHDGVESTHEASHGRAGLRIRGQAMEQFAAEIGFSLPPKALELQKVLSGHGRNRSGDTVRLLERTHDGIELTYNLSEPRNHSYVVNGVVVRNCSEYMHLDNSACNLASLNLLEFLHLSENGSVDRFDVEGFRHAVAVMFTGQEILVGRADYPTEAIGQTSRRFRQLGLGYANLGAMLMALGLPYDGDAGRAYAAAVTSLMTGHAYLTSARTAARMGPFAGYEENREHMLRVLGQHQGAASRIDEELVPAELLSAAQECWDQACELAEQVGVRNSQASVLAPTGCLVGGTLVATSRGLVRLRSLGDPDGPQWQDTRFDVLTDHGVQEATRFYVNGLEPVVDVATERGYAIRGTTGHRIKVVDPATGEWMWRRFADLRPGNLVPLALGQLIGTPNDVDLPPLSEARSSEKAARACERHLTAPTSMTAELAELLGYFMAGGSLDDRGLRLRVDGGDLDVVDHLERLAKSLFGIQARVTPAAGHVVVQLSSVRLAEWWQACGFAKHLPAARHQGKGCVPHIPDAVLRTNDAEIYRAFLRGLFEADGTVSAGCPSWSTAEAGFAAEVQSLLLALGFVTSRSQQPGGGGSELHVVRLPDSSANARWLDEVGFVSPRKAYKVDVGDAPQAARCDRFFFDRVASAALRDEEPTYDLSVPANVTYVANGFVSHNTIGLMMDCDTTGIEPDLGLVKMKKLVGGGTMSIVNQTVPRALRRLGYSEDQIDAIVAYIDEHKSIVGAPDLAPEHLAVFACSMGDNPIHYSGHVRMMAAVQPFISGAISKCVVGDTLLTTADGLVRIGDLHRGEAPDTFRDEILEVASLDGTRKTDAFYYGGQQPVREVVLRSGHRITGTPNHRLLVAGAAGAAGAAGVEWKRLDEIEVGDQVAVQYGSDLWSELPARLDDFVPTPGYGCRGDIELPAEMTADLAWLLGAYAAEGHVVAGSHTVSIACADPAVRARAVAAFREPFGLDAVEVSHAGACPQVQVASEALVELLDHLGCGRRAWQRRIPDAVLRSPRPMVLAFLEGLALGAHTVGDPVAKWVIRLESSGLLDDLQAVLTNLGVVHARIDSPNPPNGKPYRELHATGRYARRLVELVPSAHGRLAHRLDQSNLSDLSDLSEPELPEPELRFLGDGLHLSPVVAVAEGGRREVFDVSVPVTHAFVGNGIVNHNTVNMPEEVTVEEVEQLHIDAWEMGVKAIAIYRDNCKVGQPLSMATKDDRTKDDTAAGDGGMGSATEVVERVVERVVEKVIKVPVRSKLPRNRTSRTFEFRVADCKGFVTVGEYEDGRPGEIFLKVSKQGSTLAGIMDAFAISVSHGLQYGVPLRSFVEAFTNTRFEPAGMTDDPDLRIASSILDYIFRRLAVDYLSLEERRELNILTTGERTQPTLPGVEETVTETRQGPDVPADPPSIDSSSPLLSDFGDAPREPSLLERAGVTGPPVEAPPNPVIQPPGVASHDAPMCMQCGVQMIRAGSCHACPSCGSTSGCS